ncbi:hypothetical protein R1sor_008536 [Riccia sorocarpa]|uniref:SWIM-type domain-containing protein n=1 Tax=Riccia sorocarpa TaxID=122646 RepID=A0ABD3HXB0_9MARC
MSADENEALVQTDRGRKQWCLTKVPTRKCTCWEIQDCLWPCIHFVAWQKSREEDHMRYVDRIYFTKSLVQCYSKTIPFILQTELPISVACRAPPTAIRNGHQRIVRIPNGGSAWSAKSEYSYPIQDDPAMNPDAVMTNVSQEDGGERGNPPMPQSSAPQGEQLSQAPPVARRKGTRCCGACKQPGHTRRTCPALRQYRRAEVQEGLDVAADSDRWVDSGRVVSRLAKFHPCVYLSKRMKLKHNSDPWRIALMSEIRQLYFGWMRYVHGFLCDIDGTESQTAIRGGS